MEIETGVWDELIIEILTYYYYFVQGELSE